MAKKKHKPRTKYRNNGGPPAPRPASPPRPRAPRPKPEEQTPMQRLAYTAAGAAGTAIVGGMLAKQDWQPKTIAGVITAVGTALAWKGESPAIQSIGTGAMAAGGGQLALQVMDDRYEQALKELAKKAPAPARRQANGYELQPGALEAAFERGRLHTALTSDDYAGGLS